MLRIKRNENETLTAEKAALISGRGCLRRLPGCLQPLLVLLTRMEMSESAICKELWRKEDRTSKEGGWRLFGGITQVQKQLAGLRLPRTKQRERKVGFIRVTPSHAISKRSFVTINRRRAGSLSKHFRASPLGPKWAEERWFWLELLTLALIFMLGKKENQSCTLEGFGASRKCGSTGEVNSPRWRRVGVKKLQSH